MKVSQVKNDSNIKKIFTGVGISFLITIISLLIFSILLTFTQINENTIAPVIIVVTAISIFIGSSIANSKIKKNGVLNGALIGGIYIIIMYLSSSILNRQFALTSESAIMIIIAIIFGIVGGIIGVNKK